MMTDRYYLDTPKGWHIAKAAGYAFERCQVDKNCRGFVFNGKIVECNEEDTPLDLVDKYQQ